MTPRSPRRRAARASGGRESGPRIGFAWHQSSPCCASTSVALLVALRWLPSDGGGGRREVSGTAVCQSW